MPRSERPYFPALLLVLGLVFAAAGSVLLWRVWGPAVPASALSGPRFASGMAGTFLVLMGLLMAETGLRAAFPALPAHRIAGRWMHTIEWLLVVALSGWMGSLAVIVAVGPEGENIGGGITGLVLGGRIGFALGGLLLLVVAAAIFRLGPRLLSRTASRAGGPRRRPRPLPNGSAP